MLALIKRHKNIRLNTQEWVEIFMIPGGSIVILAEMICQKESMSETLDFVATELGKAKIRDNIYIFRHNPDTAYEFFSEKLESMWCDPMYESLWSGPLPDAGAENKTEFFNELYSGKSIEPQIALAMKGFVIMLFVLATIFVADRRNRKYDCNYIFLFFTGGFLLHIIWEAKSQYVYPYVFILLPCCAKEMALLSEKIHFPGKHQRTQEK